ncbi:metallophosphoesterase family protein [Cytobacillus purgationiresistens]|uniref:Phosphoesterase n=1 Tax=Cytobacillus purgationiresistens TaxID=863449 RepID=A0ABU0AFJ4_9BACI|nr:metallophosphoesterase [Cytobacillus purgationiresistens]MDQ0270031.1 putative phosphoesterase [Cytobacillus purgationiresistens]
MKLLIVSDSHGLTEELDELKARHKEEVDKWIHCGDSELSAADKSISGFTTVRGNCDAEESFPNDVVKNAGDYKLLVTHGHLYTVKSTLMKLSYRARELQANIVCFGHSHLLGAERIDNTLFLNPGSLRLPRGRKEKTYMILHLEKDTATVYVHQKDGRELEDLRSTFSLLKRA